MLFGKFIRLSNNLRISFFVPVILCTILFLNAQHSLVINDYVLNYHNKACRKILAAGLIGHLRKTDNIADIRARDYKTFFMLSSVEHEILNAHKYKNIKKIQLFSGSDKPRMLFSCS